MPIAFAPIIGLGANAARVLIKNGFPKGIEIVIDFGHPSYNVSFGTRFPEVPSFSLFPSSKKISADTKVNWGDPSPARPEGKKGSFSKSLLGAGFRSKFFKNSTLGGSSSKGSPISDDPKDDKEEMTAFWINENEAFYI